MRATNKKANKSNLVKALKLVKISKDGSKTRKNQELGPKLAH